MEKNASAGSALLPAQADERVCRWAQGGEGDVCLEDLSASSFEGGAAPSFPKRKVTGAMREYAIAGTLHLDHLAQVRNSEANSAMLDLFCFQLCGSLGIEKGDVCSRLDRLLTQHETEWKDFMGSLGKNSFLANWAAGARK